MRSDSNAATNRQQCLFVGHSSQSCRVLAAQFCVSPVTVHAWKQRKDTTNRFCRIPTPSITPFPITRTLPPCGFKLRSFNRILQNSFARSPVSNVKISMASLRKGHVNWRQARVSDSTCTSENGSMKGFTGFSILIFHNGSRKRKSCSTIHRKNAAHKRNSIRWFGGWQV